jgi:hypothetical protein
MKRSGKTNSQKQFNPIVFGVKIFVFLAIIVNIGVLGWVLRNKKLGKKDERGGFSSYLAVSPEALDFGKVQYGKAATLKLKITNVGKNSLFLSRIMSSHMEFTVLERFNGLELKKDGYTEAVILYKPMVPGKAEGKITIESSDGSKYFEVQCKGIGVMSRISTEPAAVDFGNIQQDNATATRTMAIRNSGTADLNVTNVSIKSDCIALSGTLPSGALKPGESIKFIVTYQPKRAGVNDAVISIFSSDPQIPELKVPVIAAFKKMEGEWVRKQQAKAQLDKAKQMLDSAYMKLYSSASSEVHRAELRRMGEKEFEEAYPLYLEANEELEKLDRSLVNNTYYVEDGQLKKK